MKWPRHVTKEYARGPILCVLHAHQRAHGEEFHGDCEPAVAWTGGDGQLVYCEAFEDVG